MSFFKSLMQDATPKAASLVSKTKEITHNVVSSPIAQKTGAFAYKSAVNTIGVAMVLSAPAAKKVSSVVLKLVK